LEADQIVGEQRSRKCPVVRRGREDFRRRKGGVQEETDLVPRPLATQRLGQRDQMVIMDPDPVAWLEQGRQRGGEPAVDREVNALGLAINFRQAEPVVQHRPEATVGEPEIVALVFCGSEVDGRCLDAVKAAEAGSGSRRILVRPAAPAEPETAASAQRLAHGDRQPA
jgi:hypothetical protein